MVDKLTEQDMNWDFEEHKEGLARYYGLEKRMVEKLIDNRLWGLFLSFWNALPEWRETRRIR